MEQTVKKKFGIRDIMTIAAMMVINFAIAMIIGMVTLPFPVVYLYGSAGIDAFIGAIFYLVAANRVNKHGLLFAWAAVYGVIQGVMGYMFLIPYFLIVALVAELCMVGKNTYQSAVRNRIGWMVNSIGNFVGCAVPLWWSWDSYQEMAANSGFDANTLNINQNISARKRIRSILKSYQKQETIFVNLVSCFLVHKNATIKETRTKIIVSIRR